MNEGNDGDLNIIDLNPLEMNLEKDYKQTRDSLSHIEYVIKAGRIIKSKDQFDLTEKGHILWASGKVKKDDVKLLFKRKKEFFEKYYSLFIKSYSTSVSNKILRKVD